jgi:GGDEF domain-containing protein
MISLRKTVTELDRLEEFQRAAIRCYSEALRSSGQYVVEVDAAEAAEFRTQLETLRDRLQIDPDAKQLESVQSGFEAGLKDYCEKTRAHIRRLRKDVEAAAAAVESFAGSLNESETQLESGVKRELQRLKQSSASDDIQLIRASIDAATAKISAGVEQMRTSSHLAIAQLKDEIRLLHQEVREAKAKGAAIRTVKTPEAVPVDNQLVGSHMDQMLRKNTPFSVLLVVVRNLEGLQNCFSAQVIADALGSFQARFENSLPPSAIVGRWTQNQFAAILGTAPANAMEMSSDVVRKLSAPFLEDEHSGTRSVIFTPRAGVIEFRPGSDTAKFQAKLQQLADTLSQ